MIKLIESDLLIKMSKCNYCNKRLNKRHYNCNVCKMQLECKYMSHNCNEKCLENILNQGAICLITDSDND
jgi:hypothetical protein